jgi:hypothetical protein
MAAGSSATIWSVRDGRIRHVTEVIPIPRELVWDYAEPPDDLLWRLQRIADWFPAFGRDRATVRLLYAHRDELRIPAEVRSLIELYEEEWRARTVTDVPRFTRVVGQPLRVEFVRYDVDHIEPPRPRYGPLRVDGLRDILANKLSAMVERTEPKDYADVLLLLRQPARPDGVSAPSTPRGVYVDALRVSRQGAWHAPARACGLAQRTQPRDATTNESSSRHRMHATRASAGATRPASRDTRSSARAVTGSSVGTTSAHDAIAWAHRVRNAHPDGTAVALGGSPWIWTASRS